MTSPADALPPLLARVMASPYIPVRPHPKQAAMLLCHATELLFGGSVGGGKSVAVLMDALRDVDVPGFSALLIRKTFADLSAPGCLIPLSHEWLAGTDARWDGTLMRWAFPSGATVSFGYLADPNDHLRYQGAAFQSVAFDELTQHREAQYRYLFSRLRKTTEGPLASVQIRMRSTSNPGGPGHEWVKRDFMDHPLNEDTGERRVFLPSRLADNPSLDASEYRKSLARLDPITRRQLEDGDWTARHGGSLFKREWFSLVDAAPTPKTAVRFWDLAASAGPDAKRTVGVRLARGADDKLYVEHVTAGRWPAGVRDQVILGTAQTDGPAVRVGIEQEPGSGGLAQAEAIIRLLRGFRCDAVKPSGDKFVRAGPVASAAQIGDVRIVPEGWDVAAFLDELEAVNPHEPTARQYLDRMDALSGAFEMLVRAHPNAGRPFPFNPAPKRVVIPGGRLGRPT